MTVRDGMARPVEDFESPIGAILGVFGGDATAALRAILAARPEGDPRGGETGGLTAWRAPVGPGAVSRPAGSDGGPLGGGEGPAAGDPAAADPTAPIRLTDGSEHDAAIASPFGERATPLREASWAASGGAVRTPTYHYDPKTRDGHFDKPDGGCPDAVKPDAGAPGPKPKPRERDLISDTGGDGPAGGTGRTDGGDPDAGGGRDGGAPPDAPLDDKPHGGPPLTPRPDVLPPPRPGWLPPAPTPGGGASDGGAGMTTDGGGGGVAAPDILGLVGGLLASSRAIAGSLDAGLGERLLAGNGARADAFVFRFTGKGEGNGEFGAPADLGALGAALGGFGKQAAVGALGDALHVAAEKAAAAGALDGLTLVAVADDRAVSWAAVDLDGWS